MLYTAEFQQVLERHAGEIEDLRTIGRLHGLPTGTPECLPGLPLRLAQDARLRSDLAELLRSLQAQDPEFGLPDALTILLAAIGGSPNLDRRRDLEECIDLTGGFLASLGGWPGSAVEPIIDLENPPDHDPRLDLAAETGTAAMRADLAGSATHKEEVVLSPLAAEATDDPGSASNGTVTLAEITHALARLERGNLELRLHLDSIDQRICRMEPLLEAPPHAEPMPASEIPTRDERPADAADLVHRGSISAGLRADAAAQQERFEEVKTQRRISLMSNFAEPALLPSTPPALPLSPSAAAAVPDVPVPGSLADPVSHPRMQPRKDRFAAAREIPGNSAEMDPLYTAPDADLSSLAPRPTQAEAPTAIPEAATASAAAPAEAAGSQTGSRIEAPRGPSHDEAQLAAAQEVRGSRERLFQTASETLGDSRQAPPAESTESFWRAESELKPRPRSRATAWVAGVAATAVVGAAGFLYLNGLPSFVNEWVGGGSRGTVSSSSGMESPGNSGNAQPAAGSDAAEGSAGAPSRGASSAGSSTHGPSARESASSTSSVERTSGPTFVPGGIMDGYLIAAPRPAYPELARLVGAQGKVTFEAMVSKGGQVEAVKVLGGPQVLRSAATDAVKQWQYRPFEVKGRPVEVRTIIRVDVGSHAGAAAD